VGQDHGIEQLVVASGEASGAHRLFPHPLGEPSLEGLLALPGRHRGGDVEDALVVVTHVVDRHRLLDQRLLQDGHGVEA